jgi:hypothetical protein
VYLMAVWYSLWSLRIFFLFLVCVDQEKSGNPAQKGGAEVSNRRNQASIAFRAAVHECRDDYLQLLQKSKTCAETGPLSWDRCYDF